MGNPKCPESEKEPERIDLIPITHGHGDHVGETVELAEEFDCPVVARVELDGWLVSSRARPRARCPIRTRAAPSRSTGVKFTLTDANHSSPLDDGTYLGEPAGPRLRARGRDELYFAGDTNVFGDMALIRRIY